MESYGLLFPILLPMFVKDRSVYFFGDACRVLQAFVPCGFASHGVTRENFARDVAYLIRLSVPSSLWGYPSNEREVSGGSYS